MINLLFLLFIFACTETNISTPEVPEKLEIKKTISTPLNHLVFLKLKEGIDLDSLIVEINKIKAIEVLHDLEIGTFKDLGDQRALSEFGLSMHMKFASEADYRAYQNDSLHLALKAATKEYLAGPPATYDYWVKE